MKFLIGCDPEIFLADAAGALVSSVGLVGGSKEYPRPLFELGEGFNVQEDNVAIEFGVPPSDSAEQFAERVSKIREYLREQIKTHLSLDLVNVSAAIFPEEQLQTEAARMFGCEPDYNAWTKAVNPKPAAADWRLRSAGGHIHVGYAFRDSDEAFKLGQYMDLTAGVPATIMDNGELRKELYGKHGACRIKPYGMEYRVLSNFWIFDDAKIKWAYAATQRAIQMYETNEVKIDDLHAEIVETIDNNNKVLAKELVKKYNLPCLEV